jgi:hypothetical protein
MHRRANRTSSSGNTTTCPSDTSGPTKRLHRNRGRKIGVGNGHHKPATSTTATTGVDRSGTRTTCTAIGPDSPGPSDIPCSNDGNSTTAATTATSNRTGTTTSPSACSALNQRSNRSPGQSRLRSIRTGKNRIGSSRTALSRRRCRHRTGSATSASTTSATSTAISAAGRRSIDPDNTRTSHATSTTSTPGTNSLTHRSSTGTAACRRCAPCRTVGTDDRAYTQRQRATHKQPESGQIYRSHTPDTQIVVMEITNQRQRCNNVCISVSTRSVQAPVGIGCRGRYDRLHDRAAFNSQRTDIRKPDLSRNHDPNLKRMCRIRDIERNFHGETVES